MGYKFTEHKGHVIKHYDYINRSDKSIGSKYKDYFDKQRTYQDYFEHGDTSAGKTMFQNQYQHAKDAELTTLPQAIFTQGLVVLCALAVSKGIIDQGMGIEALKGIAAAGFLESIFVGTEVHNFKLFHNAKQQLKTINKIYEDEVSKYKDPNLEEMLSNYYSEEPENTNTIKR